MAYVLAAAATAAEYRQRNGRLSADGDAYLGDLLTTVTRVCERRVGVAPGMFNAQTDSLSFTFRAIGGTRLYLRDGRGSQHFLRGVSADGIDIDSEQDGTFDGYQLDFADAWVVGYPRDALQFSEPHTALDILPGVANAAPTSWADGYEVRITSTLWGWAAVPGSFKERVIGITRELVEAHQAGVALSDLAIEAALERLPLARSLMALLEREYRYRLPAGVL